MKPTIAITLILTGAALILAPFVSGYLYEAQLAHLLAQPNIQSVDIQRGLSGAYAWACMAVGVGMIGASILLSAPIPSTEGLPEAPHPSGLAYRPES
jgi:hypothetical protein